MTEAEYRNKIQKVYDLIEAAFEPVDPDVAECEQSMGALTITFGDRSKCILSAQPSVRQLWLALASRGIAYHFNYDDKTEEWIDDKGRNLELLKTLKSFFKEVTGLDVKL